ncbi:MAG: UDP-glucose 4-epimerase [Elusimicrobia bacterium RIFOXYB2_FULL_49_7]|nr:MAG: UDP-glucose 4-epimerase [Elusimicrobia bacterium RIFOXYB2_FULL_49_7]
MKVLVTGGAGFIGSNIVDAFVKAGHSVSVVDNLSSGNIKNVSPIADFFKADITHIPKIKQLFAKGKFDVVCHHAAQIDVRKSIADPAFDAQVNILGTLNILENAKNYGVKKIIFASSGGTIYGECGKQAPDETATGRPISPYGIAKHSIEFYLRYYSLIHGMRYTVLRYANVYGPRQDPHGEAGVVAIFSQKMLGGEKLTIFGDGKQTRDYVFVGDVVRANVSALTKGHNEIINIGTGVLTSVNGLFHSMARITHYDHKPQYKPARAGELLKSFLNYQKAKKILGWEPKVTLGSGLKQTIDYFSGK